jgi:hypothetical protein
LLHIFTWWLILQVLGWAALPLAYRLLKWLPGRGYTFAKPLGLLLVSYTFWILTSFGFLRNTWAAIEWLQANAPGVPVILEAPGRSYNYEGRISAFTGFPAVLGWSLHEGQTSRRSTPPMMDNRRWACCTNGRWITSSWARPSGAMWNSFAAPRTAIVVLPRH